MKILKLVTFVFALTAALIACSNKPAEEASAPPDKAAAIGPVAKPSESARPAPPVADREAVASRAPTTIPAPATIKVPAGTAINVILIDSISTEKNQAGDQFLASLAEPLTVNGKTVADRGTKVHGRIVDAVGAARVKGRASMRIVLTSIMNGEKAIPIVTEPLVTEAEATKGRDATVVGGAAGVGALIGAIAGGKKGAAIGTAVGAGSGAGAVLATKGKEVEFGSETKLKFTLERAADLPMIRTTKVS